MKPGVPPATALLAFLCLAAAGPLPGQGPAAELVATINTGDDLAVVAAWSPEGTRLAYGTEKEVRRRPLTPAGRETTYPGEVWVSDFKDKPKLILKYDFLRRRRGDFFSFSVEQLAWSPDGGKLAVEMRDEEKNTVTYLLTAEGKRVEVGSSRESFLAGYGAGWLGDSETLAFLTEAMAPRLLHRVSVARVTAGRAIPFFAGSTFAAAAWLERAHKAVLVERDQEFARTPRLMLGNLESGELETLAELDDGYLGGLQASPDETRVAYFVGQEKLAVRGLSAEAEVEHWPVPFGRYGWAGPRRAVLYIEPEGPGRRTGWLTLYDAEQKRKQRVLPEEPIQDFWVSPDGQQVAVLTVGLKPLLKVYRLASATAPH